MMMIPRRCAAVLALLLAACGGRDEPADVPQPEDSVQAMQPAPAAQPVDTATPAAPVSAAVPAEPRDTMLTQWSPLQMPSEPWEQSAATPEALLRQV
ncbi:MAG TPA: hypothetical protein VEQ60_16370, partial [Longimicrobium sp.]|nr:hypothetical protein [Longimicrobium sp.]